jgi:hypothetical protein
MGRVSPASRLRVCGSYFHHHHFPRPLWGRSQPRDCQEWITTSRAVCSRLLPMRYRGLSALLVLGPIGRVFLLESGREAGAIREKVPVLVADEAQGCSGDSAGLRGG